MTTHTQQQPPAQRSPTQEQSQTAAPAVEQPAGNQQAAQDAGLATDQPDTDTSLLGPFAEMMLSAMPLSVALPLALPFLANPAVRRWLLSLAPDAVGRLLQSDPGLSHALLEKVWPVGIGFQVAAGDDLALKGAKGNPAFSRSAVHAAPGSVEESLSVSLVVGRGKGGGLDATDSLGGGAASEAKAGATLGLDVEGHSYAPFPDQWWDLLGKTPLDVLLDIASGVRAPPTLATGAAPGEAWRFSAATSMGAEAGAAMSALGVSDWPAWLVPLVDQLAPEEAAGHAGSAEVQAALGAGVVVRNVAEVSSAGASCALEAQGTLTALARGGMPTLLPSSDAQALHEVAQVAGGGTLEATVALRAQAGPAGLSLTVGGVEVTRTALQGAVEQASTKAFPGLGALAAYTRSLSDVGPEPGAGEVPLQEVLDAGVAVDRTLSTTVTLDPAALPSVAPGVWSEILSLVGPEAPRSGVVLAESAELSLAGTARITQAHLEQAAAAGVVAPGPTAGTAVDATADALLALASGEDAPSWAARWDSALRGIATDLWTHSQVTGWAGVGAGEVSAKVLVAVPTTPEQHAVLAAATR